MFIYSLVFLLLCFPCALFAQSPVITPEEVAQLQLNAYNSRDLEAFLAVFDEEAELYTFGESAPRAKGKAALRELYGNLFASSPNLHSKVVNRSVLGNKVLDYELVTGRAGSENEVLEIIAIYVIENQLIKQCHIIRK